MTDETPRLTREELKLIALDVNGLDSVRRPEIAHLCLELMDERDRAQRALSRVHDAWGDKGPGVGPGIST